MNTITIEPRRTTVRGDFAIVIALPLDSSRSLNQWRASGSLQSAASRIWRWLHNWSESLSDHRIEFHADVRGKPLAAMLRFAADDAASTADAIRVALTDFRPWCDTAVIETERNTGDFEAALGRAERRALDTLTPIFDGDSRP